MAAWATGIQLGPYVLLAPLGAGGMGEVWKARDTRLARIVAVKRLKTRHSARFEQEARVIAALNHPYICQIFDIGPDYLVLEYIDGKPLAGPLPVAEAARLAMQIAEALEVAHRKGVVHRDLKPANILLTAEGSMKLLDFGLAKQMIDSEETQTLEGTVMGTAAYMAPEQAAGKPTDVRSDVFSFGAVLYELLSGRRAFSGENSISTMAAILHKEPAPLDAPSALQQVVKRCLMKSPEDRFQTMAELADKLKLIRLEDGDARPSIAVLPFANLSGDKDNEYFSDGLAEEIINALAQNAGLKVIARTSAFAFRGKEQDIRKIAEALDVRTVLEGSVRRAGNRIRVMAQLINATDGSHLWSQRYDREMADIFELQDEIAHVIASALHVKLNPVPSPVGQYTPNLAAYEALLKARYYFARPSPALWPQMKEAFEQAIALDPNWALPHCEYGLYFLVQAAIGLMPANQALPAIRTHARRALELDPSIPEGHAMLGFASWTDDWSEIERRFTLAIARGPVSPLVRWMRSFFLGITGKHGEAIHEVEVALQEDPFNMMFLMAHRTLLTFAGRDDEAVVRTEEMLKLDPNCPPALAMLAWHRILRGELDQALALAEQLYPLAPFVPQAIGLLAGLLEISSDTRRARELLDKLRPGEAYGAPRGLAIYHWVRGDTDAFADWTEKALDQQDPAAPLLLLGWPGRALRSTPHWARLMRKLNLPETR